MKAYVSYTILLTINDVEDYNDAVVKATEFAEKEKFINLVNDIDVDVID